MLLRMILMQMATRDGAREHLEGRPIRLFCWNPMLWAHTLVEARCHRGRVLALQRVEKRLREREWDHSGQ
jgi:hypothetical protein